MIPPIDCPYKGLSAPPCRRCTRFIPDTGQCIRGVTSAAMDLSEQTAFVTNAESFNERMKRYEEDRKELLKLSKEALVDLILHKPTMF